jgi:hypothetical protein
MLVVAAPRVREVQQLAGDIGGIDVAGVGVFDLVQAALAAAVAQRFPLGPAERRERPFPETVLVL